MTELTLIIMTISGIVAGALAGFAAGYVACGRAMIEARDAEAYEDIMVRVNRRLSKARAAADREVPLCR